MPGYGGRSRKNSPKSSTMCYLLPHISASRSPTSHHRICFSGLLSAGDAGVARNISTLPIGTKRKRRRPKVYLTACKGRRLRGATWRKTPAESIQNRRSPGIRCRRVFGNTSQEESTLPVLGRAIAVHSPAAQTTCCTKSARPSRCRSPCLLGSTTARAIMNNRTNSGTVSSSLQRSGRP